MRSADRPRPSSARLAYRELAPADLDAFHGLVVDPHVRRFLFDGEVLGRAWAADAVATSARSFAERGLGLWLLTEGDDSAGGAVGFAGFWVFEEHGPEPELVYALREPFTGRGLASEAAATLVRHARAHAALTDVLAAADVANVASLRVLEGLGFERRGEAPGALGPVTLLRLPAEREPPPSQLDLRHLRRAVELALAAEAAGNMPIGAVLAIGEEVVAEAGNALLVPAYDPGGHAEVAAIRKVPSAAWTRAARMTCYTTLEPCVMCMGTLLLHGVRRVVFGALDAEGGARFVLPHLPPYYRAGTLRWEGPALPAVCDPLYRRALARFTTLPCGAR